MTTAIPTVVPERHLYKIPEAMSLLSMSRSVIYELIRAGRLRTVTQGRSRLVPAKAINEYIELLLSESEEVGCGQVVRFGSCSGVITRLQEPR